MLDFNTFSWFVVSFCAVMIGFSKTGIPGAAILVIPLLAGIMPARDSTGFLLPILALADIMAIIYWRRHVDWPRLLRLLPWTMLGVGIGYIVLKYITNKQLMPVIGIVVLILIAVTWWTNSRGGAKKKIPTYWWFAAIMGILAGSTSMMANAAGPIMTIYLLAMRLEKNEFIGTTAWFFWMLNLSKIPFSTNLGLINEASLLTDLALLPCIILGGIGGIMLVHRIPQRAFNITVEALAAISAIYLCLRAFM